MSCEACLLSAAMDREQFEQVKKEAKQYAVEHKKDMAIYKEGYQYFFIEASTAIEGGYLIRDVVSQY